MARNALVDGGDDVAIDDQNVIGLLDAYTEAVRRTSSDNCSEQTDGTRIREHRNAILNAPPKTRVALTMNIAQRLSQFEEDLWAQSGGDPDRYNQLADGGEFVRQRELSKLMFRLLRAQSPLREDNLALLISLSAKRGTLWPHAGLVLAAERFAKKNGVPPALKDGLLQMQSFLGKTCVPENAQLAERIAVLLQPATTIKLEIPRTPFGQWLIAFVKGQEAQAQEHWVALIKHAMTTGGKGKPTPKWLEKAQPLVEAVGRRELTDFIMAGPEQISPDLLLREPNADLIKGLLWISARANDERLPAFLGRLGERCYKKVPGLGPANKKLGNACIVALSLMANERAAAELVRLQGRIKFNQGRDQLAKALDGIADQLGLGVEDLEELTLPDFGLGPDGAMREELGQFVAEIRITGSDEVSLGWFDAEGNARKSVPTAVRTEFGDALKDLSATVKEIKGLLGGQRHRLESLYLRQRSWPYALWRERYRDHPLLSHLARRLIWSFANGERGVTAIPVGDGLVDTNGKQVDWIDDGTTVSLWHPLESTPEAVLGWRRRLAALEITQPFKQAHREIYLLTDAERATEIYSNRFAAHILKQHQLNALCQARGWRYSLQGAWDQPEDVPSLSLENWGLSVEFWTGYVNDETTDIGVYLYQNTDQVRFLNRLEEPVRLEDVPPLAFSEAMRDVDLFVGVCSVANDANWTDGGPDDRFRDYFANWRAADLSESAKTRRAVLEDLLPMLKIADLCRLEGKYLHVRGTRRDYKIHLGSGNILMSPNDQYLCIVPRYKKSTDIRLPFEGDGILSVIISKAFMLASDDEITDRTILSQIGR